MDTSYICTALMDGFPYPIVFVDTDHIIRYLNRAAQYHYCIERGQGDLLGKSLFDCHFNPASREMIEAVVKKFKKDAKERFLKVNDRNLRVYITPVLNDDKVLIGHYERFEMNLQLPVPAQQGAPVNAAARRH